jgi:hypothetical protein
MGIITPITIMLLHLVAITLDIIVVFILARLLSTRLSWKLVVAFDAAGRPLTDTILNAVDRIFSNSEHGRLRENSKIGLALIGLLLLRFVCSAIASALN